MLNGINTHTALDYLLTISDTFRALKKCYSKGFINMFSLNARPKAGGKSSYTCYRRVVSEALSS